MVLIKSKSIAQIRKEIAEQKKRIAKEEDINKAIAEKQKLSSELFRLKQRKLIGAGAKAKRISKKFGKALLSVGKKSAPIIKKQARLIRDQQLRDDAIARARSKKQKKIIKKIRKSSPKKKSDLGVFGNLDF